MTLSNCYNKDVRTCGGHHAKTKIDKLLDNMQLEIGEQHQPAVLFHNSKNRSVRLRKVQHHGFTEAIVIIASPTVA